MAAPGIGYIRVNRFAGTTMQEFRQSFDGSALSPHLSSTCAATAEASWTRR